MRRKGQLEKSLDSNGSRSHVFAAPSGYATPAVLHILCKCAMKEGKDIGLVWARFEQVALEAVRFGKDFAGVERGVEGEDAIFIAITTLEAERVFEEVANPVSGIRGFLEKVENGT